MDAKKTNHSQSIIFALLVLLTICSPALAITQNAVWDGSSDGDGDNVNWGDPFNWDKDVVPVNLGTVTFNVTIPAGKTVTYNVPGDSQINNFTLGDSGSSDAQLIISTDCNLEVLGTADIYELINGNGGNFTSVADSDSLDGTRNRVYAQNGSHITISDTEFNSTGLNGGNYTLLSSDGAGSVLELSGMTDLNDGFSNTGYHVNLTHTISATNDGFIKMSELINLTGPGDTEALNINVNTGGSIDLGSLDTISHAGGYGFTYFNLIDSTLSFPALSILEYTKFTLDNSTVNLPALTVVNSSLFDLTNNSKAYANSSSFTCSATGLNWGSFTLFSSDGAGSILDLSGMTSLNDGFSNTGYHVNLTHTISATNDGFIKMSELINLTGPGDTEALNIDVNDAFIDMSSLDTISGNSGRVYINIDDRSEMFLGDIVFGDDVSVTLGGGSYLSSKGMAATQPVSITMDDPNDILEVAGDFDLSDKITVSNSGDGTFVFGGDLTYLHKDETLFPLANFRVYFNGRGPQSVEVGGLDVDVYTEFLNNDNFGYGQMIVGRCSQPSVVYMVDHVDNGNRSGGVPEALYLFGKDGQDGLRILYGSTLYMGNLPVYALIGGVITDLRTLFAPGETCIPFDEGTLCLGYPDVDGPDNLITNGGFEYGVNPPNAVDPCIPLPVDSNDITGWTVVQDIIYWVHEAYFTDPLDPCDSERTVELSGTATGKGGISQQIETVPGICIMSSLTWERIHTVT